jgi:MOB kinase activator 1
VRLPEGEDLNEWLATNTVDFFNTLSLLYGAVSEFCTPLTCPVMCAGPRYEYLWAAPGSKPARVSAPEYIDLLLNSTEASLSNEDLFPTAPGRPFTKAFLPEVRTIYKRLFRIFAHLYYHHFDKVVELGAESHLNTSLKHFVLFCEAFQLVDAKELAPLDELIAALTAGGSGTADTGEATAGGVVPGVGAAPAGGASSSMPSTAPPTAPPTLPAAASVAAPYPVAGEMEGGNPQSAPDTSRQA